jgi:aspartate-semialdehyde dehydrogenase
MHPQTRLGYEILPYLRELDGHEWTAEERKFLSDTERVLSQPPRPYAFLHSHREPTARPRFGASASIRWGGPT